MFAPSAEEVARARAVIAAFALPENAGKGVIKVDGRMTELLHLEEARRVVAIGRGDQPNSVSAGRASMSHRIVSTARNAGTPHSSQARKSL